jgi:hypothetical protein
MACHPDLSVGVECCDVVIQILCSVVVVVLLAEGGNKTGRVAGVGRSLTVADLAPKILPALAAAAAEEQVVVDLIVGSRVRAVEHGG